MAGSFVSSSRRTVHRGTREDGADCGTQQDGEWGHVDAETEEEAVLRYNLVPCRRCIDRSMELERWRKDLYSSLVMHKPGTPERWKRYARTGELEAPTNGGGA